MTSLHHFALGLVVVILLGVSPSLATVSHVVPGGTVGNQTFGGSLGMDFDVVEGVTVTGLGVFDSGSDGLTRPLTAQLYNRAAGFTESPIATLSFTPGDAGVLADGSRFKSLPVAVELPAGFQGTVVASGYGSGEPNGNSNGGVPGWTTDDGGGLLNFVGTSRFGTAHVFPANPDGGPANRYAAGTSEFDSSLFEPVALQNATAVHSQGGFAVGNMIDGSGTTGWANSGLEASNTAVFETTTDLVSQVGHALHLSFISGGFTLHTMGRFRISVTGDDRSTFADGAANGGDVTANWEVLEVTGVMSGNLGTTFDLLPDGSLLAGGTPAEFETYTIRGKTGLNTITGLRVEMLLDPSLPQMGPGRAGNGNYVIYDLQVAATPLPEPTTALLLLLGGVAPLMRRGRGGCRRV